MTETRRSVFRTSILSAFGLMTGTAIVATARAANAPESSTTDMHAEIETVTVGGTDYQWIVLQADNSNYKISCFTPPTAWPFDSYAVTNCTLVPIPKTTVTIKGSAKTLMTDSNSEVAQSDLTGLGLAQFDWNEIGVKLHSTVGGVHRHRK